MKDIIEKIKELKKTLGDRVVIPAHHYQKIEIVRLSDFVGDSYKLAVDCSNTESEFIVFCGVRFMAEGAQLLSKKYQKIIMPDLDAGCPLADMIDSEITEKLFKKLSKSCKREIIPLVYMNSYSDMKSFCGRKGGSVCTSSNAGKIIEYYLSQDKAVFFSPDYNLGINTARQLKIPSEEIVKINRDLTIESEMDIENVRLFIWDGFCHVHKIFRVDDIIKLRAKHPGINIIVHPECEEEVVNSSDISGSTQKIYQTIKDSPQGSIWGVGTEFNFVSRIAEDFKDKRIIPLRNSPCIDMEKINLKNLVQSLSSILDHKTGKAELKFEVKVHEEFQLPARKALKKMIEISKG